MSDDELAIRDLVDTWLAASKAGDVAKILTLMSDDVVFMVPGSEPFGKEAFAVAAKGQGAVQIDGTSEIQEIKLLGDWAYMRNHLTITVTPSQGAPIRRKDHTLTIFRKQPDGSWVIARDANLMTTDN